MKKSIKILLASAALTCFMAFPALAAETKEEYKTEAEPVRSELHELEAVMKPLREENKAVAAKYKAIRLEKKNEGTLRISKEKWEKAKELHKRIAEIHKDRKESLPKTLRTEAKSAVKEKDYDTAVQKLNEALDLKKSRMDSLEELHDLWGQIDELLG